MDHRRFACLGRVRALALIAPLSLATLFFADAAQARRGGIAAPGCDGCHSGGRTANVGITLEPAVFAPGATVTATISVQAVNGNTAGFYMTSDVGRFSAGTSQGIRVISNTEVSHSTPKTGSGNILFQVQWTAPAQPGGLNLEVFALSANGNGSTSGDGPGSTSLSVAFGCEGTRYYVDFDGDGYGQTDYPTILDCAQRTGYSKTAGDCNDNDREIHPGADERCNRLDDNCNAQIDEGLSMGAVTFYPDADRDGYGTSRGTPMMGVGCAAPAGYSPAIGDCADNNAMVHPGVEDICNLIDDNCDGRADERSRPRCGIGMCERLSMSCNASDCIAGVPRTELCNAADDDCDGVVDNEAPCAAGQICQQGSCVAGEGAGTGGTGSAQAGAGGTIGAGGTANPSAGRQGSEPGGSAPMSTEAEPSGCALRRAHSSGLHAKGWWFFGLLFAYTLRQRGRLRRGVTAPRWPAIDS